MPNHALKPTAGRLEYCNREDTSRRRFRKLALASGGCACVSLGVFTTLSVGHSTNSQMDARGMKLAAIKT